MIKTRKQMYLVIASFALVMLLGTTTYAFFNYTRTGARNVIRTGRIYFNSEQGTAINLTNLFPVDPTETGVMDDTTKVGTVTINAIGDTTYTDGIEYKVSAVNVQNTTGNKSLPISIQVSVENNNENDPATSLGTVDADYFTNRGPNVSTSIYKILAKDVIKNNQELVVGYIKSGQEGVDGNIVIKAYIDKNKIAISDTYPESTVREVEENYSTSACETALTGVANASTICASSEALEGAIGSLTNEQLTALVNAEVLREYINGTPTSFGEGRTVLTTTEWNSLQNSGVSFQVKVEANEGIWVEEPATPDEYFSVSLVSHTIYNTNRTSEDIANCVTYFTNKGWNEDLQEGETIEAYCAGTGTIGGITMQQELAAQQEFDYPGFDQLISDLESINIVLDVPEAVITGYNPEGGSDVIIPNNINVRTYQYNTSRTSEDIANCVTYFTNQGLNEALQEGETLEEFCAGTGTIEGNTMQEWVDFGVLDGSSLASMNILTFISQSKYQVTEIRTNAFSHKQLTSVSIPNSVTKIGKRAFQGNLLTQLVVPDVYFENNSSYICKSDTIVQQTNSLEHEYRVLRLRLTDNISGSIIDEGTQIINKSGNKYCTAAPNGTM